MTIDTNIIYTKENIGKNLYRKKTYYTLVVEQEVLAKDKDEADQKFLDDGGIDHSQINHEITTTKNSVETYMVDANYSDSGDTEYLGKVAYDEDDEYAEEDGNVVIDTYADENTSQIKEESPLQDYKENVLKEESDIDVAIQLEAENKRGK
jgi:hypothetical protein